MADAPAQHPAPPAATVADVMQPPVTTVEKNDHVAAAAYVMKRANAEVMTSRRFRHLPVVGDAGLVGIVDITDVCRVLLDAGVSGPLAAETGRGQATSAAAEASDP